MPGSFDEDDVTSNKSTAGNGTTGLKETLDQTHGTDSVLPDPSALLKARGSTPDNVFPELQKVQLDDIAYQASSGSSMATFSSPNNRSFSPAVDYAAESRPAVPIALISKMVYAVGPSSDSLNASQVQDDTPSWPNVPESSTIIEPRKVSSEPNEVLHNPSSKIRDRPPSSINDIANPIAGLERLMQEAIDLAKEAAESGRGEEVPQILEEATATIRNLARIQEHHEMTSQDSELLRVSRHDLKHMASSYSDDDTSTFSSDSSMSLPSPVILPLHHTPVLSATTRDFLDAPNVPCALEQDTAIDAVEPEVPSDIRSPKVLDWAYESARGESHSNGADRIGDNAQNDIAPSGEDGSNEHILSVDDKTIASMQRPAAVRRKPRFEGNDSETSERLPVGRTAGEMLVDNAGHNWGRDKYDEKDYVSSDVLKGKHHYTLADHQHFSIHHHRRQPIARNWGTKRKRWTAFVACANTALLGILIGIYAGEVPAIQYLLTDNDHVVILGNTALYIGMAISTFFLWPLPMLHGRKPYTLLGLALSLPLQFPQSVIVITQRNPENVGWRAGLVVTRFAQGLAMGLVHVNTKATLLDLYGASLQSTHPHGELVITDDVRRHGGGIGLWLGWWSFSFIGSLSIGFLIGAGIISHLSVPWGFYISVILIAAALLLNVLAPETRRAPHRRTMAEVQLPNMNVTRRVARGEIRMHVWGDGPKWWWEEVAAGAYLSLRMMGQVGFSLMSMYLAWIYGQVILIIVLLGNLLSVSYQWHPQFVGLGVFSIAVGAFLAIPDTKANIFSRSRTHGARTDSMTFQPRVTWTSHLVRRATFMLLLPLAGMAYTLASAGRWINYGVPMTFAGVIGYLTVLAIAECHGLIMETYDTCDLQPGVNSRHRLQSLAPTVRKRRTTYSSYPRVSAGLFAAQTLGFLLAAAATGVGGVLTRAVGAQKATGIVAGVLLGLTILLTAALWRYKTVQVIPNELFGSGRGRRASIASDKSDVSWRAVIIGNPSGKMRRMSMLELGGLSRWTEIRRLNRLLNRTATMPLNWGWR